MWLIGLLDQHYLAIDRDVLNASAMRYDLSDLGDTLSWRKLYTLCITNVADPQSLLAQALNPELSVWGSLTDFLLAEIADRQAWQMYQASGGKGKKPEPIERPGHSKKNRSLLFDGGFYDSEGREVKLNKAAIEDPREWLASTDDRWATFEALRTGKIPPKPRVPAGYSQDARGRWHGPNGKFVKAPTLN